MRTFVISDVHGQAEALNTAMVFAGLIDNHGNKAANSFIIQIGDLANCVKDSKEEDLKCLSMVENGYIDLLLMGNHEIPYFDRENAFHGFHFYGELAGCLWRLNEDGKIHPSCVWEDTLISHAGVSHDPWYPTSAQQIHDSVSEKWKSALFSSPIFADVGSARMGRANVGGMLWCDFDREFMPTCFPQIIGHTPGILRQKENALCIDTGAKNGGTPTIMQLL